MEAHAVYTFFSQRSLSGGQTDSSLMAYPNTIHSLLDGYACLNYHSVTVEWWLGMRRRRQHEKKDRPSAWPSPQTALLILVR